MPILLDPAELDHGFHIEKVRLPRESMVTLVGGSLMTPPAKDVMFEDATVSDLSLS